MDWTDIVLSIMPQRLKARLANSLPHGEGWGGAWGEPPPPPVTARPRLFATSGAVNAAVGEIADRAAATEWRLYRVAADGDASQVLRHPVLDLLGNPNPFMTEFELKWYTEADKQLAGNAYWYLAGSQGRPVEIWRLNPRNVRLVRDNERYIRGYVYEVDGRQIPLEREEVIHFRMPNPLDDFWGYGLPRLYAAALAAQTGTEMAQWNRASFTGRNVGIPAGIVNVQEFVSDADFERIKREWTEKYSGPDRKTAFIRGGTVTFEKIALTQQDVDFINGLGWTRSEVFDVFRTFHLKVGTVADSEGAIKVLERLFLEGGLWPQLRHTAEKITDDLLPFFARTGALRLEFEDIRPRERALELQEAQERSKGLTFNEWRAAHELDPLPEWEGLLFWHVVNKGIMPLSVRQAITPPPPPQLAPFVGGEQSPAGANPDDSQRQNERARQDDRANQDAERRAENQQGRGEDVGDGIGNYADKAVTWTPSPADIGRELATWERWALRRVETLATSG